MSPDIHARRGPAKLHFDRKPSQVVNPLDSQNELKSKVKLPRILSPTMRNIQNNKPRRISGYSRKGHVLKRHTLDDSE